MALWDFWFLWDGSCLEKRREVYRGKQSKPAKVKSKPILDMLPKINENDIDSIPDVFTTENTLIRYDKIYKNFKQRNQTVWYCKLYCVSESTKRFLKMYFHV